MENNQLDFLFNNSVPVTGAPEEEQEIVIPIEEQI